MPELTYTYNLEWSPIKFDFTNVTPQLPSFLLNNSDYAIYGAYGSLTPWDYTKSFDKIEPWNQDKNYNHNVGVIKYMLGFLIILVNHRKKFLKDYNWPVIEGPGTTYQSLIDSTTYTGDTTFDVITGEVENNPFIVWQPTDGMFNFNGEILYSDYLCPLMKEIVMNIWEIYQPRFVETIDSTRDYYWADPTKTNNIRLQILPEFYEWVEKIENNPDFECTIGDFDSMYYWSKRQLSWLRKIVYILNSESARITHTNVKHDSTFVEKFVTASNSTYEIHGMFNRGGFPFVFNPDNPNQTWHSPSYNFYNVPGASSIYSIGYNPDGTKKFWQRVPQVFYERGVGISVWPSSGMERIAVGSGIISGTSSLHGYFQAGLGQNQIFMGYPSMVDYKNFVQYEITHQGYQYAAGIKIFPFGRIVTDADNNFNFQYYNEPTYFTHSFYSNVFRISPWTKFTKDFPCRRIIGGVQTTETNSTQYYDSDTNSYNLFLLGNWGCYHRTLFSSPFQLTEISGKNNIVSGSFPNKQTLEEYTKEYTFTITHTTNEEFNNDDYQINGQFYINPDINNVEIRINGELITQNLLQNPDRFSSPDAEGFRTMYDVGKIITVNVKNLNINNNLSYTSLVTTEISAATTIQCFNATYHQNVLNNGFGENHYNYDILNMYPKSIPANYKTIRTASFPYTAPNYFKFAYKNSTITIREVE